MAVQIVQYIIFALLAALLIFNLTQRRHLEHGEKKRFASLGFAGLLLIIYAGSAVVAREFLPAAVLLIPTAISLALGVTFRKKLFIFSRRCPECGKPLKLKQVLYRDGAVCDSCFVPRTVDDIDWDTWVPDQDAVVCYIVSGGKVLLINKKTGLGAGKVNAPGGRIEPGETPEEAAVRECREEVGMVPGKIVKQADLSFVFTDGLSLHCSVYFSDSYTGTLTETDEADPFWCGLDEIPFEEMWEDDELWLPPALEGKCMVGKFIFDGDAMLSEDLREVDGF